MFRPKRRVQGEVELNVTAMLDMAFQLLAFFVLTFKPAPAEQQIRLHLPPPTPTAGIAGKPVHPGDNRNAPLLADLNKLTITVLGDAAGNIDKIFIGESPVANVKVLEGKLASVFGDAGSPFDQVLLQIGSNVRYQSLMQIIDSCAKTRLSHGELLTKLTFVELPNGM